MLHCANERNLQVLRSRTLSTLSKSNVLFVGQLVTFRSRRWLRVSEPYARASSVHSCSCCLVSTLSRSSSRMSRTSFNRASSSTSLFVCPASQATGHLGASDGLTFESTCACMITAKDGTKAIGSILTETIFREEDVAQCAPQLPVVSKLNAKHPDWLSVSCAYHLLKGKVFTYVSRPAAHTFMCGAAS